MSLAQPWWAGKSVPTKSSIPATSPMNAGGWSSRAKTRTLFPRRYFLVEAQSDASFRLTNLSTSVSLELTDGRQVPPTAACLVDASVLIAAGDRRIRLRPAVPSPSLHELDEATVPPGRRDAAAALRVWSRRRRGPVSAPLAPVGNGRSSKCRHLRRLLHQGRPPLVDMVRLDSGAVLLRHDDGWQAASGAPSGRLVRIS